MNAEQRKMIEQLKRLERYFEQLSGDAKAVRDATISRVESSDFQKGMAEGRLQAFEQTYRMLKQQLNNLEQASN